MRLFLFVNFFCFFHKWIIAPYMYTIHRSFTSLQFIIQKALICHPSLSALKKFLLPLLTILRGEGEQHSVYIYIGEFVLYYHRFYRFFGGKSFFSFSLLHYTILYYTIYTHSIAIRCSRENIFYDQTAIAPCCSRRRRPEKVAAHF